MPLTATAALLLLLAGGYVALQRAIEEDHSRANFNSTPEDAAREGTLVRRVEVRPQTLTRSWGTVQVGDAWVHENSHIRYRHLVRRERVREGTFTLCFNLAAANPASASVHPLEQNRLRWFVNLATGEPFDGAQWFGPPWRFCQPVEPPIPAVVHIAFVERDSLRAKLPGLIGMLVPPMPPLMRELAAVPLPPQRDSVPPGRLSYVSWSGYRFFLLSMRAGADSVSVSQPRVPAVEKWQVQAVLDEADTAPDQDLHFGTCTRNGTPAPGVVAIISWADTTQVLKAWHADLARGQFHEVPTRGIRCVRRSGGNA